MKSVIISNNDANQRVDRFLMKLLPNANKNFIMKMIRKKNIVLNNKKIEASTMLVVGDEIKIFFSDETYDKFSANKSDYAHIKLDIVYEDENILVLDKPSGLLSHVSKNLKEKNLIDGAIHYLIEKGEYNPRIENSFVPALCNRLDRNTAGLVIVGKNAEALREMNKLIKSREVKKFYRAIVVGKAELDCELRDNMKRDEEKNRSMISKSGVEMISHVKTITADEKFSLVEIELITGRTHQIRLQLANISHPILGDPKYGNYNTNEVLKDINLNSKQLLASVRLEFPELSGVLRELSNKKLVSRYLSKLNTIMEKLI